MPLKLKLRLALGIFVMLLLLLDLLSDPFLVIVSTAIAYIAVSYTVIRAAFRDLFIRHRMSEQFLMTIATFGALGLQDYAEALAVMIFYLIGDAFEEYAAQRSHQEITSLIKLKPSSVRLINEDGTESIVKPRKVKIGQKIRVLAGEAIAIDGQLINDSASVDLSALNGESEPALFTKGQDVPSGGINMGGVIELIVSCESKNSSINRLINLIEDAAANKSRPEALITRFSVYYTPIVVALAAILALVPVVVPSATFSEWIPRALVFLVVSCPCALVLSVPLSFFGGLGAISKIGVMVKGSVHIESLAKLKAIAFDKTGTITKGKFTIIDIDDFSTSEAKEHSFVSTQINLSNNTDLQQQDEQDLTKNITFTANKLDLLKKIYALESFTTHPIGTAIVNYCKEQNLEKLEAQDVVEIPGYGIEGTINGVKVIIGKRDLVTKKLNLIVPQSYLVGTEIYVVENNQVLGRVTLADQIKESATAMFDEFQQLKVDTFMITGDKEAVAADIAQRCHIKGYFAEQLPIDKINTFKHLKEQKGIVAYVGDGINDAPTLAASDVGIAMGQFGSASAVEAADVVVMNDDLTKIPHAIDLAKRTYHLAKQNMIFVIAVKLIILILGAFGLANIWLAILGDVGLTVLAVLNAMRTLTWVKQS